MREFLRMLRDLFSERRLLISFSINDFKSRYADSLLGIIWAFISPLVMVGTYWFVFTFGIRPGATGDYPFLVYLITGIIPWFFFSDVLASTTGVFRDYSYLVKKVVFNIRLLPTSKLLSNMITHLFFIIVAFLLVTLHGIYPTLKIIQLVYYLFAMSAFLTGITWITSSVQPFFPDISQIIGLIMQVLMWSVPILWSPLTTSFSPIVLKILKLNPMYYIIVGYRDSFLGEAWFWNHPWQTLYFWVLTFILLLLGANIFKRLRPHFSDVL